MSKFRVSRFLKRDLVVRVSFLSDTGIITNARKQFAFYPSGNIEDEGWYETTDEVLLQSLKDLKEQLPYSADTEQGLINDNVQYEYAYCASCGGKKIRKLEYHLFEVIE